MTGSMQAVQGAGLLIRIEQVDPRNAFICRAVRPGSEVTDIRLAREAGFRGRRAPNERL